MAFDSFDRNYKFYKEFDGKFGWKYKLYFVPGGIIDLSSPAEVEFPNGIIQPDIKCSADYDKNLPLGLPLANESSITLNLNNFRNKGSDDWETVRDWILDAKYPNVRTISVGSLSKDVYIPNRWYLLSNNGVVGGAYNYLEFDTVQDKTPGWKIKKGKYASDVTLKCLDINRYLLENLDIDTYCQYVRLQSLDGYADDYVWNTVWDVSGWKYGILSKLYFGSSLYFKVWYASLNNLSTVWMAECLTYLIQAVTRNASATYQCNPSWFWNQQFYRQNLNKNAQIGTDLTYTDIMAVVAVTQHDADFPSGRLVGGMCYNSKSENNFYKFPNLWDLNKYIAEQTFVKGEFSVGTTFDDKVLYWDRIFNPSLVGTEENPELFARDFISEIEFSSGIEAQMVSKGISHVSNVFEGATLKLQSEDITIPADQLEFEVKNDNAILSDKAMEFEHIFHNHQISATNDSYQQTLFTVLHHPSVIMRGLYYAHSGNSLDTLVRVHDWFEIDCGDGVIISSDDISADTDMWTIPDGGIFALVWTLWLTDRLHHSGLAYTSAKAALAGFGTDKQLIINATTRLHKALPRYLGAGYKININSLLPGNNNTKYSDKAYLTGIETDYVSHESTCKFFVRGDS
jgi:hypothetical protein